MHRPSLDCMDRPVSLVTLLLLLSWACASGGNRDAPPGPPPGPQRAPDHMLRDPLARLELKLRLHRQILQRTRQLDESTYQTKVRPGLTRQLQALGLDAADVRDVLDEVDRSRR